jgi:hypothetical protein
MHNVEENERSGKEHGLQAYEVAGRGSGQDIFSALMHGPQLQELKVQPHYDHNGSTVRAIAIQAVMCF